MSVNNSAFNSRLISTGFYRKTRVVPKKDAHYFNDLTFWKFLNKRNVLSISKKIYYRHFLRMDFEYKYVWVFIRRSIGALFNKLFFRRRYKDVDFLQEKAKQVECFFFPLHVKLDFSLTVRSPKNLDQINVINQICELIGERGVLFVKEHPASSGAYGFGSQTFDAPKESNMVKAFREYI